MKKLTVFSVLVLVCIVLGSVVAVSASELSARAVALGGSYVALADDSTAPDWNPAGLVNLNERRFQLDMNSLNPFNFHLSYAEPDYGNGAGALNWIRYKTVVGNSYNIVSYSIAKPFTPSFAAGVNTKYLVYNNKRYFTSDLGLLLQFGPLCIGAMAENVLYKPLGDGERDLNTEVKIGTTIDLANYAILSVEVRNLLNHDKNSDWSIGAEITPLENLALRAGWRRTFENDDVLSAGVGYSLANWRFDLAIYGRINDGINGIRPVIAIGTGF